MLQPGSVAAARIGNLICRYCGLGLRAVIAKALARIYEWHLAADAAGALKLPARGG
jgi:hypothetical protein